MNIATATPAEIDAKLAELESEAARHQATINQIDAWIKYTTEHGGVTPASEFAKRAASVTAIDDLDAEIRPLQARYRRELWNRAFLVTNTNGHVHSTTGCDTCFRTTEFAWLTDWSGMDRAAIIEAAQDQICLSCFPEAKGRVFRPGKVLNPRTAAERRQRAEEKAKRDAERAAKGISNPDGTALRAVDSQINGKLRDGSEIKTERAASNVALGCAFSQLWYSQDGKQHPFHAAWEATFDRCAAALAHKRGTDVATEAAALREKAAKKFQRETR